MKIIKKNIILAGFLAVLSLNSFAGSVTPSASFGTATHVVVGQNGSTSLVMARNAKGDIFVGKAQYVPGQGTYYGTYETNAHVRSAANGAVSNGTVKATITQQVSKRAVTDEILKKAKVAGRALGKGAAGLGRAAATRHPWGLAFALALEGIAGSGIFWDDEKGDFVRKKDDNTYIVFSSDNPASVRYEDYFLTYKKYHDACKSADCNFISFEEGRENAKKAADNYCKSISFKSSDETHHYEKIQLDVSSNCYSPRFNLISKKFVFIVPYYDTVPINNDEFFDESEPDADANADEWVKTSEVQPTDEPKVEVPAGTVAQSDAYTDPKDGKPKQTRWDFDTGGRVRETVILRPDLVPDSPEAPRLDPPNEEETPKDKESDDKEKDKEQDKEQFDLCKEHPEILACQKMGEVKEEDGFFDDIKIPQVTDDTTWEEDRFLPSNGTCPAPKVFHVWGKPFQVSYEPLCSLMEQVRFIILVAFIVMSAYLVFGSLFRKD